MTGAARCDEILSLIDEMLGEDVSPRNVATVADHQAVEGSEPRRRVA